MWGILDGKICAKERERGKWRLSRGEGRRKCLGGKKTGGKGRVVQKDFFFLFKKKERRKMGKDDFSI